jgi:RNA polymerase sigma-70 factor (ECF subfamily)
MDISAVLSRIQSGDRQAFAAVVTHSQGPLFGFLGRMGLTRCQTEDLAQETLLRAWQNLGRFDPNRGAFSTWLFTIARHLALNELSRAAHGREVTAGEGALPEAAWDGAQSQDALIQGERRRRLHGALRRLPPHERCLVALAYVKDLDLAEIARMEACSAGAVKTRLHRARLILRDLLEKEDD